MQRKPAPNSAEKPISKSAAKLRLLKTLHCTTKFETQAWSTGAKLVAGIDEVGRGSLFGPVVAGAVILDPEYRIRGLRDSKLLPEARREQLAERIRAALRCVGRRRRRRRPHRPDQYLSCFAAGDG